MPGTGHSSVQVVYFPRPKSRPEHDGSWLKVHAGSGRSWLGVFAFGYASPPAFSGVVSSPDPDRFCIVSRGCVHCEGGRSRKLGTGSGSPVLDVRQITERGLLLFSDFTRLAAFGSGGLVWRSQRVCWDELKITEVTRDRVEGVGSDPTNFGKSRFAVDIATSRSLLASPESRDGTPLW
jgi:hypothetical protein